MKTSSFKKETIWFLGLFILIFAAVFSAVTILDISKNLPAVDSFVFSISEQTQQKESPQCIPTEKENSISIPKINITAPLVFTEEEDIDFKKELDKGVVHYPESIMPGEQGTAIFLGHSAPTGWPKIKHDWVFSKLNSLADGDNVYIYYNGCQYVYTVFGKYFLDKGEEIPEQAMTENESNIILISCWPPGKDFRRIAIVAKQQ